MRQIRFFGYSLFFLILIFLNGSASGQDDSTATIQEEHKSFYRVNSEIDFNTVLELNTYSMLVDLAAFHHEANVLEQTDIVQRVALYGDDVRKPACLDCTDSIRPAD